MKGILTGIFCFVTLINALLGADTPYFHSFEAQAGDGLITVLNRYELEEFDCDVDKFLELNGLKRNDYLLAGKEYKLPVLIYKYNGKSIRSTLGIDDMETAKRIANYNRIALNRSLRKSDYESSQILWVPYHELNCPADNPKPIAVDVTEVKPSTPVSNELTSIFGSEYCKLTKKSDKLKGKVFYISGGHGGPDPGAVATMGGRSICEDEYAYDVSLRLARNLMEQGATVHIIIQDANDGIRNDDILNCDHDEKTSGTLTIPINQLARLKQRTDAINELYAEYHRKGVKEQTLVCIHVDSRSENCRQDVFFYHFEHSKEGKKLAQNVQQVFQEKYAKYRPDGEYHGTVSCRNLYMLRVPFPTTLYVELANIKNEYDRK
ncbi:MAG TPA: N-acetylmuramoyl-L-alanine amidase, partial [Saprospiraceae bacterium]|nr:N-acetylmuramoyl-L-alanine amidase [Saprospiraceae bacterium]